MICNWLLNPMRSHPMHRYLGLLLLAIVGLLALSGPPANPVAAQQETPDLATYESWLREARVAAQRSDRLSLEDAAERLTGASEVQVSVELTVPVDNSWLSDALAEPDPPFGQIADRLGALLDALVQPGDTPPDDAQQRLENILSRPPFAAAEPENPTFISRFFDWLFNVLERLFRPAAEAGASSGNLIGWLIGGICLVLLAGVLFYLLRNVRYTLTRDAQQAAADDFEASLTANEALNQASTVAREGDYRTAVRYLYLSSLLWLDERGMLRYDRALTNYEYLAHLSENPALRARLLPIVETFDRVWYGHMPLDDADFQHYQRQVEELRSSQKG